MTFTFLYQAPVCSQFIEKSMLSASAFVEFLNALLGNSCTVSVLIFMQLFG